MTRCQSCNKLPVLEMGEPEAEIDVEKNVDGDAHVTGNVRIVIVCSECGDELKEASFDVDVIIEVGHKHDCQEDSGVSVEFEVEKFDEFIPPGKKRQVHMYGASGTIKASCDSCGATGSEDWRESIKSSAMDEI